MRRGLPDFARVTVVATPWQTTEVVVDITPNPDDYPPSPDWIVAARRGARLAMCRLDGETGRWHVRVANVEGSISDTRPQAVFCATVQAVWAAIAPDTPQPIVDDGDRLRIVLPLTATV